MLLALTLLMAGLAVLGCAGIVPALRRRSLLAMAVLCGSGWAIAAAALMAGTVDTLAAGPRGAALAVDGVAAAFLLPLLGMATAGLVAGLPHAGPPHVGTGTPSEIPLLGLGLASLGVMLLAQPGLLMVLGYGCASAAGWGASVARAAPGDSPDQAGRVSAIGAGLLGSVALAGAVALLQVPEPPLPVGGPASVRAGARLGLAVLAALCLAWQPSGHSGSRLGTGMPGTGRILAAVYLLIRMSFSSDDSGAWGWFGMALLGGSGVLALFGAYRAAVGTQLGQVLAGCGLSGAGSAIAALAVAMIARGADLPGVAALAAGSALLQVFGLAAAHGGLGLAAGVIEHAAGSRHLARLGGLAQRAPTTTACALVCAASLAGLPPLAGFSGQWMLLQSLMSVARGAWPALHVLLAAGTVLLALASGLAAAAMVRLAGVALLGRPRSPRAVAAEDPGRPTRAALIGLAALCVLAGLLPGPLLLLLDDAVRSIAGAGLDDEAGWMVLASGGGLPGYSAPGVALLLGVAGVGGALIVRPWTAGGVRKAPRWDGGLGAPPPWLPFGDPATQYGAHPPLAALAGGWRPAWQDAAGRQWLRIAGLVREWLAVPSDRVSAWMARHGAMLVLCALGAALGMAAWVGTP